MNPNNCCKATVKMPYVDVSKNKVDKRLGDAEKARVLALIDDVLHILGDD